MLSGSNAVGDTVEFINIQHMSLVCDWVKSI